MHIECGTTPCDFNNIIKNELINKDNLLIYTNKCPRDDDCVTYKKGILTSDEKAFAKYMCEPVDSLKKEVDRVIEKLPLNYGILHFRFEDGVFWKDINIKNDRFLEYFEILKKIYRPNDVVLSNSTNFKYYAKEKLNINIIDCDDEPCAISHVAFSVDYESTKNTFIDFYVIANAKYIKTISVYTWISNFVKLPALIYDVPIEEIR